MIKSYPEGSDITIMNTLYLRPHKLDNGKSSKDQLLITYKDNKLGKKKFELMFHLHSELFFYSSIYFWLLSKLFYWYSK